MKYIYSFNQPQILGIWQSVCIYIVEIGILSLSLEMEFSSEDFLTSVRPGKAKYAKPWDRRGEPDG